MTVPYTIEPYIEKHNGKYFVYYYNMHFELTRSKGYYTRRGVERELRAVEKYCKALNQKIFCTDSK